MASKIRVKRRAPGSDHNQARNGFTDILRDLTVDRNLAIGAIRAGLPASLLKDAGLYFNVPAQRIRAIARLPDTTAHALIRRGANLAQPHLP